MSKPRGKCQFCGATRDLTKGHVWPDWLNQILPQTATHHEQETGKFYTFDSDVPGPAYDKRVRQGHARSRKPRNTCLRCNTGWMSGIEKLAKHIAVPLIQGYAPILNPFRQFVLSSLLCLIAMRLEFLGEMRAISQQDRDWLRCQREPNLNWKIWIAHFVGDDADQHWCRTYAVQHVESTPAEKIGPDYCDTRITTFVIGRLCAHIFYSQDTEFVSKFAYDGVQLTQVWPASWFDLHTIGMGGLDGRSVLWLHETYAKLGRRLPATQ